jgi:hypothetical protein
MLTKTHTFVVLVAVILASSLPELKAREASSLVVVELKAKEKFAHLEEVNDEFALLDEEGDTISNNKEVVVDDKKGPKDRELFGYGYGSPGVCSDEMLYLPWLLIVVRRWATVVADRRLVSHAPPESSSPLPALSASAWSTPRHPTETGTLQYKTLPAPTCPSMSVQVSITPISTIFVEGTLLCSNCVLSEGGGRAGDIGNPTKCCILRVSYFAGIDNEELKNDSSIVTEVPFISEYKFMATIYEPTAADKAPAGTYIAYVTGAPNGMVKFCKNRAKGGVMGGDNLEPINEDFWLEQIAILISHGLRVLGLTKCFVPKSSISAKFVEINTRYADLQTPDMIDWTTLQGVTTCVPTELLFKIRATAFNVLDFGAILIRELLLQSPVSKAGNCMAFYDSLALTQEEEVRRRFVCLIYTSLVSF